MKASLKDSKAKVKAVINSIQFEVEEIIKNQMENVLVSVDQQTQGLHEEFREKIKKNTPALTLNS
jgi:hypothetical protein